MTHEWILKIAEATVPEETYLAHSVAEAYFSEVQQSDDREAFLGDRTTQETNIFNACQPCDMHLLLPSVLNSVFHSANHLILLLTSDESKDLIEVAAILLPLALHKHSDTVIQNFYLEMDEEHPLAKAAIDDLSEGFKKAGMHHDDAIPAAFRTIIQFIRAPKSGLDFLSNFRKKKER